MSDVVTEKTSKTYPECEKLSDLSEKRGIILEFLEWLGENSMEIRSTEFTDSDDWMCPLACLSNEQLSHKFLDIDDAKLNAERLDMLASLTAN